MAYKYHKAQNGYEGFDAKGLYRIWGSRYEPGVGIHRIIERLTPNNHHYYTLEIIDSPWSSGHFSGHEEVIPEPII